MRYEEFRRLTGASEMGTSEMGRLFGLRPHGINNWRLRDTVPYKQVVLAIKSGVLKTEADVYIVQFRKSQRVIKKVATLDVEQCKIENVTLEFIRADVISAPTQKNDSERFLEFINGSRI